MVAGVRKPSILWVAHEGVNSGANTALLNYAEALNSQGFEVTIIVPYLGSFAEAASNRNIKTKRFYYTWIVYWQEKQPKAEWWRRRIRNVVTFFQVISFLIAKKPALVITNSIVNSPVFGFACKFVGIKHIWFVQEFGDKDHAFRFDWGYRNTLRVINIVSKKVITVSSAVKQHLSQIISPQKIDVIFNRVKVKDSYQQSGLQKKNNDTFSILHLAPLGQAKNQLETVQAAAILLKQGYDIKLELAGDYSKILWYSNVVRKFIEEHHLESSVSLTGHTDSPHEKIRDADVVVLASRCEACALTIFETLQIGTPIIVSNTGGNAEIIEDNTTGLVYEFGNPESLAGKIRLLIEDRKLGSYLATNGIEKAKGEYSIRRSVEELKAIIGDVLLDSAGKK